MKKSFYAPMALLAAVVLLALGSCKLDYPSVPHYTEFILQIDSITHPDTIRLGSLLPIRFYGTIGQDGCYSFSRFDGNLVGKMINVTAYGKKSDNQVCTQQEQYLDGRTLNVIQLDTGMYVIHILQALPPDITDTVYVKGLSPLK